ncbi:unnamed protein product [Lepidochelys olivacea]
MPTDSEELSEEHYDECSLRLKCRNDADIELAFSNISKAQEKPQIRHTRSRTHTRGKLTLEVGDSVMLLNARRKTRKGGPLQPTYCGPYKVTTVQGKRVKLETISGKLLGSMYSISLLKLFKEPPTLGPENRSQENMEMGDSEKTLVSEEIGETGGNVSRQPHDSQVIKGEVTGMEEEECVVAEVASSDPSDVDDMLMGDGEDKEWFLKDNACHTFTFKPFVNKLPFMKHVKSFWIRMAAFMMVKQRKK